ncbi:MAG: cell division protein ZapA [Colwellia sp.]|nr:cell division protein ZapA [Colwellia sp.]
MGQQHLEITIADRTLKISCPSGQESALLGAADELNSRIIKSNSCTMITTPEQSLLMTALNLSNELLAAQAQIARERKAYQSKINLLKSTIERAMFESKEKQT